MAFRFLHTADWQIGKVFGQFANADTAAILRQARLEAIDRIADAARSGGAAHVLVAGDVFDSETLKHDLIAKTLARLAANRDLTWHFISGNHDPARAGGIWDAVQALRAPENVRLHLKPAPAEIAQDVHLLPAPLAAKAMSTDPTVWMDAAATPPGALRIGIAHGSIKGFGGLGEAAVPVDPTRVKSAGLSFLAMGDWHGAMEVGPRLWYSGTPEQDGYGDNKPGHVLLVSLDGASAPNVTEIATSRFWWREREIELNDIDGLAPIESDVARFGSAAPSHLFRIILRGTISLALADDLERRLQTMAASLLDFRIDKHALQFRDRRRRFGGAWRHRPAGRRQATSRSHRGGGHQGPAHR